MQYIKRNVCVSQNSPSKTVHGGKPVDLLYTLEEQKICQRVDTKIDTEVKIHFLLGLPSMHRSK